MYPKGGSTFLVKRHFFHDLYTSTQNRRRRRKHYPSSSEYESEESEGPDSVTSSSYSEDEKNYKRKCKYYPFPVIILSVQTFFLNRE